MTESPTIILNSLPSSFHTGANMAQSEAFIPFGPGSFVERVCVVGTSLLFLVARHLCRLTNLYFCVSSQLYFLLTFIASSSSPVKIRQTVFLSFFIFCPVVEIFGKLWSVVS